MGLELDTLMFDCADPLAVATFWAGALGHEIDHDPDDPDDDSAFLLDPSGRTPCMYFQSVPETKTVKNRVHLDVRPTGTMAEEVERLKGLGATVRGYIEEGGSFWTQMRDVEGNEFCVLRGPGDGWSRGEL
ncbi:MAG: VOC family protein [Actinobacteria bacterium]|nr:VOC family protein [Actinomycetota bacterium]